MKRKFPSLLFFLVSLWCNTLFAQQKESFHLHIDKNIYLPGETIWFKAYTYWDNAPSIISTNLYVAMYDATGQLIASKQYPLLEGTCSGDIEIPDTIASKGVVLQLFTKNSLIADSTHLYKRLIPLYQSGNTNGIAALPENNQSENIQLQFFPEAGSMLAGMSNHLVVMSSNQDGTPLSTGIAIVETGANILIDSIYTDADGIGKMQLMPVAGKSYKGVTTSKQEVQQTFNLPAIIQSGAMLHAEWSGKNIFYSVQKNTSVPRLNRLQLAVISGKDVLYKASLNMAQNNQMVNTIPTDSFPPGIVFITLYDNDNNFLQAKPVLIDKKVPAPIIRLVEQNLGAKGKNSFDILIADTSLYNLSVSVSDAIFEIDNNPSLYPEILLPARNRQLQQSFSKAVNEKNQLKIDMLLTAAQLPFSNAETVIVPDDYLSLKLAYNDGNKTLPKKSSSTLILNDKAMGKQFFTLQPTSPNSYNMSGLQFYDSAKIYFQVNEYKALNENLHIELVDALYSKKWITPMEDHQFLFKNILGSYETYFDNYFQHRQQSFNELQTLQSVVVKSKYVNPITKRLQELDKKYSTGMFSGLARGVQLNALDDPATERVLDVYNYIVFRIPGLAIGGPVGSRTITNSSFKGGVPIVFLNESEVPPQTLETISTSQLAYVKFVAGIVVGGSFVSESGALFVYTKKGDEPGTQTPSMKKTTLKGYDISNDFKVVDHSNSKAAPSTDYRSTLYWNPYVLLDKNNRTASITYYNNDVATKHLISIRGYREDGTLVELRQLVE